MMSEHVLDKMEEVATKPCEKLEDNMYDELANAYNKLEESVASGSSSTASSVGAMAPPMATTAATTSPAWPVAQKKRMLPALQHDQGLCQ